MTWLFSFFRADSNLIKKIYVFIIVLIISLLAMSSLALFSVAEWKRSLDSFQVGSALPSEKIKIILQETDEIKFRMLGFVAERFPASSAKTKLTEKHEIINTAYNDFLNQIQVSSLKPEEVEVLEQIKVGKGEFDKFIFKALGELANDERENVGTIIDNDLPAITTDFIKPLNKFLEFDATHVQEKYLYSIGTVKSFKYVMIFMIVFFLALAFYAVYFVRQFKKLSNWSIENLKSVEASLVRNSSNVKSASDRLTDITKSNRQSVERTSVSLNEITSMMKVTSDHAMQSNDFAKSTGQTAERGATVVVSMLRSIETINKTISNIIHEMQKMDSDFKTIESIFSEVEHKTKLIHDIVFQTKLLSFNASVESARAGEHGKGFAVVAEEIGNLAQMSGKAAEEISDLIVNGSRQVSTIVTSGKDNLAKLSLEAETSVTEGMEKASECNKSFQAISESLTKIQALIMELTRAANEQSIGVSEVNMGMNLISQTTEQGNLISNETQSISGQVQTEAVNLKETVDSLVRIFNG